MSNVTTKIYHFHLTRVSVPLIASQFKQSTCTKHSCLIHRVQWLTVSN